MASAGLAGGTLRTGARTGGRREGPRGWLAGALALVLCAALPPPEAPQAASRGRMTSTIKRRMGRVSSV